MRARFDKRGRHHRRVTMHLAAHIDTAYTARTLAVGRVKIVRAVEHHGIVGTLVLAAGHSAFELLCPTRATYLLKEGWQQGAEPLGGHTPEALTF